MERTSLLGCGPARAQVLREATLVAAICIVGRKNAGKTTLIERLIPELIARGRRVATIKHDAHDFEIDVVGKDTWRHRQAGSRTTIIASSSKVAMVRLTEREAGLGELLHLVDPTYDLILVEGLRRSVLPKIVVHRAALGPDPQDVVGEVWAVVTDGETDSAPAAPRLRPDDARGIVDLIEGRLVGKPVSARRPDRRLRARRGQTSR